MDDADLKERQEFEVEAIKAIYLSDAKDLRANINDQPVLSIRLLPQRGSSGGERREFSPTTVLMTIKMPAEYPNVVPEISLSGVKGLSSQEVAELQKELEKLATSSTGEVMILNLAQLAEGYLHMHQKTPTGSFYDEMMMRKKLLQEQSNQKKQDTFEKERLAIREEIQRKQDALKEELRRRKEEWRAQNEMRDKISPPPSYQSSPVKGDGFPQTVQTIPKNKKRRSISLRRRRSTSEGSDSSLSEYSDVVTLDFSCHKVIRKYQRGELIGESKKGSRVYAGMDCNSGSLVAISEWNFPIGKRDKKGRLIKEVGGGEGHSLSYDAVLKQLSAFESEFNLLQKLEHGNIVLYLGIKVMAAEDSGCACLYVAQEFIHGTTLQSYLQDMMSLDVAVVRHIAQGILQALEYLHSNNVVHRFLRDTSVFVDRTGEIKVGDYGLERKICEFFQNVTGSHDFEIDKFPPSIGRGAKKGDIYRFGVLILSLLQGRPVTQNPPEIPPRVPLELQDFLRKCLTTNEHVRWTATQLLDHTFLKMQLQRGPMMRCFRENGSHGIDNKEEEDHDKEVDSRIFSLPICKESSRLQNEFEVIQWLGKGGFGDVLKVRNKLDGGVYALKRIRLNPRNKLLNKKITREVKLLSQLNHENVVRYFNSWIETVIDCASDESSSTALTSSLPQTDVTNNATNNLNPKGSHSVRFKLDNGHQNSLGLDDNIEALAPPAKDSEWSISIQDGVDAEESDESSEEEDIFGTSFLHLGGDGESDGIIFESDTPDNKEQSDRVSSKAGSEVAIRSEDVKSNDTNNRGILSEMQYMYIQMEFCEKSTLRTAIDNGLYQDGDRVWRLFREIVEGLVHIHQQGMIHRDLKPVNIFLDSNDHVKIGDFGLATTNILNKNTSDAVLEGIKPDVHQSMDFGEESMTGHVGTALYVAPELVTTSAKAMYNQKVDIYSLGIILFEMFYRPLSTGMERVRIIAGLRQKEIVLPSDFHEQLLPQVEYILRWVLDHDPGKRPTSVELLQSDYMPPPLMEETELHDMFRHTLSNSQSKAYKYLVASCFQQTVSTAEDITYNYGMGRSNDVAPEPEELLSSFTLASKTRKVIQNVFERHGAVELSAPLLTPKSDLYEYHKATVHLMSHNGGIVTIPYDLRVPFARYVVWNQIPNMKRYCIGKVFRENKVFGYHPSELYECAFDVISPSKGTLISDAETLAVTFEIINELPWLRHKEFTIRLSHTFLLDAVLLHFGIDEKYHEEIKSILAAAKPDRNTKSQIQTHLVSLCLPDQFISMLFNLMEIEGPLAKASNIFKGILKKKSAAASKVKEALHELETLIGHLESFGPKCEVAVSPSVLLGTNMYTGLLFQVVCNLKKRKNKQTVDVVAVGGRYDTLLEKFRSTLEMYGQISKDITQSGVGISISLDKLVAGLEKEERDRYGANRTVDAIICSMGHHSMSREKITIMKDFLSHGIQCIVLDEAQTLESAEEHCRQLGALFIVILKETEDLRIRALEKDRFQERRVTKAEAVDFILRSRRAFESTDILGSVKGDSQRGERVGGQSTDLNGMDKSQPVSANMPPVSISFVLQEKDKLASWKRRYENQMMSHIEGVLPKLSKQQVVELVGLDVNSAIVKSLALLQVQEKEDYGKSVGEIVEKHPRYKKYVEAVCDLIYELSFEREKTSPVIIVYSLLDNYFRILM